MAERGKDKEDDKSGGILGSENTINFHIQLQSAKVTS